MSSRVLAMQMMERSEQNKKTVLLNPKMRKMYILRNREIGQREAMLDQRYQRKYI